MDAFYNECTLSENEETTELDDQIWSALYDGSTISRKDSEMLLMALALRHNLPDVALENTMHLIDCHLHNAEYRPKYRFLQQFPSTDMIEYYYCAACHIILTFDDKENSICNICKKNYKKKN